MSASQKSSFASWPFAPPAAPKAAIEPGAFVFAAAFFEHGHLFLQCDGLIQAGAELRWIYDPDPQKLFALQQRFPQAKPARSFDEILADPAVRLVTSAAIPNQRAEIGARVMRAGKDYFTDKSPFTTLEQLAETKAVVAETSRKYLVYYSERLHVEAAVYSGQLVREGAIGRVLQVLGLGPHRLGKAPRPPWFYQREKMGGILCDIGSHQCDQFLSFSGATDASVMHAAVANYAHPEKPEFEDFGEAVLLGNNGATGYHRLDWFTPDGLRTWGDGRMTILGTKGYIEMRKYIDISREDGGDQIYLVNETGEYHFSAAGKVGFPFFRELISDCLQRSESAMTQAHAFKAAELSLEAQRAARRLSPSLA